MLVLAESTEFVRWKPREYVNMLLQLLMQIEIPSSFSISRIKD